LVAKTIKLLAEDPAYKSLRTKKMKGKNRYYESSVNMDIRILWEYQNNNVIALFKVGHHDILRKY
jgi:mRNA-degrading endonuclease YafQ of YafQ-DinJ toxin-antitoxin module